MNEKLLEKMGDSNFIIELLNKVSIGILPVESAAYEMHQYLLNNLQRLQWLCNIENTVNVANLIFVQLFPDSPGAKVFALSSVKEVKETSENMTEDMACYRGVDLLVSHIVRHKKDSNISRGAKLVSNYLEEQGYAPDPNELIIE
jgi:hypothetical protein